MKNPDITDPAIVPSNEPKEPKAKKIIPKKDLDLILEVGLDMSMTHEEIWEFASESDIAKELADFYKPREGQREKLALLFLSEREKKEMQQTNRRFLEEIIRNSIKNFQRQKHLRPQKSD